MRNNRWLRYSLASLTLVGAGLGTFLAACGDDDSTVAPGKTDGGGDTGTTPDGSTTPDTGTDAKTPIDAGTPAKIYLVHAGTNLGPNTATTGPFTGGVRVCFSTSTDNGVSFTPTPFPALPSDGGSGPFPGLFVGTGGVFPSSGADLEEIAIRPYLMNAKSLSDRGVVGQDPSVPRCGKLLADGGIDGGNLEADKDLWQLADIPKGTLKKEKTYILAVTGCTQDAAGVTAGFCGNGNGGTPFIPDGNPGVGNLKILILELDNSTAVSADEFAAQAINLSPQQDTLKVNPMFGGPFVPTLANAEFLDGGDGADAAGGKFAVSAGEVAYNRNATTPTATAKIKGLVTSTGYFALSPTNPLTGALIGPSKLNNVGAAIPQTTVQFATTGNAANMTELYVNGKAYTFVLVGQPGLNPATEGPRALHYIAFPNKQ